LPDDSPLQTIYGYHTVETHMGQVQWELFGEKAERYSGEEDLYLIGVRMLFYEDGLLSATLTSQRGRVNEATHDMTAKGEVEIVTEDDRTLRSEILHWDNERQLIHTAEYFRATDAGQVLTGIGLETDPKMTDLVIMRQVEGDAPDPSSSSDGGGKD
jgi:LPS export ABC transporter protein LptC